MRQWLPFEAITSPSTAYLIDMEEQIRRILVNAERSRLLQFRKPIAAAKEADT